MQNFRPLQLSSIKMSDRTFSLGYHKKAATKGWLEKRNMKVELARAGKKPVTLPKLKCLEEKDG